MKAGNFSNAFHLKVLENISALRHRSFCNGSCHKPMDNGSVKSDRKTLPWIAAYRNREAKESQNVRTERSSSWDDSANIYFSRTHSKPSSGYRKSRFESVDNIENGRNRYQKTSEGEDASTLKSGRFSESWANKLTERRESMKVNPNDMRHHTNSSEADVDEKDENDVDEPIDDPRWDRIKTKFHRIVDREVRFEKPEVERWNKQENWGRKTWKETTASTVPKMVGEGVYGVGPVLAALAVARREFYTLYVQEGLDLTGNNRKKKDKKGIERVLKIAEKIGLTVKETSKHDLNMVVDNRPHQGLVLDASPLEMVSIRELDPISPDSEKAPLWVALDEVSDPQNLGAIVRSAYFFGASGVVLCAKNSAPLSGVVSKASAGSLELIELRSCKNMMQFLSKSAENGWRVLGGSVSSRALPLNEVATGGPTILVLGSEGSGLRPLVEKSCTELIRIPGNIQMDTSGRFVEGEEDELAESKCRGVEFLSFMAVESLNVSVAAGVLLYHLVGSSNDLSSDKQTGTIE